MALALVCAMPGSVAIARIARVKKYLIFILIEFKKMSVKLKG
jgi:hypothetical protein